MHKEYSPLINGKNINELMGLLKMSGEDMKQLSNFAGVIVKHIPHLNMLLDEHNWWVDMYEMNGRQHVHDNGRNIVSISVKYVNEDKGGLYFPKHAQVRIILEGQRQGDCDGTYLANGVFEIEVKWNWDTHSYIVQSNCFTSTIGRNLKKVDFDHTIVRTAPITYYEIAMEKIDDVKDMRQERLYNNDPNVFEVDYKSRLHSYITMDPERMLEWEWNPEVSVVRECKDCGAINVYLPDERLCAVCGGAYIIYVRDATTEDVCVSVRDMLES